MFIYDCAVNHFTTAIKAGDYRFHNQHQSHCRIVVIATARVDLDGGKAVGAGHYAVDVQETGQRESHILEHLVVLSGSPRNRFGRVTSIVNNSKITFAIVYEQLNDVAVVFGM